MSDMLTKDDTRWWLDKGIRYGQTNVLYWIGKALAQDGGDLRTAMDALKLGYERGSKEPTVQPEPPEPMGYFFSDEATERVIN